MGFGHLSQDGTAAPGEKAKPEKPEGSARSYVDAVKHEDQKNRKAGAQQAKDRWAARRARGARDGLPQGPPLHPAPQRGPQAALCARFWGKGIDPEVGGGYLPRCLAWLKCSATVPEGPEATGPHRHGTETVTFQRAGQPLLPLPPAPRERQRLSPALYPLPHHCRRGGRTHTVGGVSQCGCSCVNAQSINKDRVCVCARVCAWACTGAEGGTDLEVTGVSSVAFLQPPEPRRRSHGVLSCNPVERFQIRPLPAPSIHQGGRRAWEAQVESQFLHDAL